MNEVSFFETNPYKGFQTKKINMITKNIDKRKVLSVFLLIVLALSFFPSFVSAQELPEDNKTTIYFFWGDGCPHCATEKPYLEEWQKKYGDQIEIKSFETWKDQSNVPLFQEVANAHGIQARGVPTTFIGEKNWVGFSSSMAPEMESYIKECIETGCENLAKDIDFSRRGSSKEILDEIENTDLCIHVFLDNCAECQNIENYLKNIEENYNIGIEKYNVNEEENKQTFQEFKDKYGLKVNLYPTLFIGDSYIIGEEPIKTALEGEIETCLEEGCPCPLSKVKPFTPITAKPEDVTSDEKQTINILGKEIDVGKMPLVFSTLVISFIDGFNPCSLWVITFLLGIVILTGSRKKIFAIGFTYLAVASAAYGAFILGMISVFAYIGYLMWIRVLVASIAIIFALVNIKDFFWYKKGISFTIPDSYKPRIYKKIRNIMRPDNNFRTLLIGSAIMALGITLVELPCTAGFPMVWSNIMAAHNLSWGFFATLFLIYLIVYFSIELVIFLSVVFTLKASKIEKKHGRLLKLIGGVIMFALAMVLLFNPNLLNDIGATILLFATAIGISLLIAWIYKKKVGFEENETKLASEKEKSQKKSENNSMEGEKQKNQEQEEKIKKDENKNINEGKENE